MPQSRYITSVIINIATGEVEHEVCVPYSGPWTLCADAEGEGGEGGESSEGGGEEGSEGGGDEGTSEEESSTRQWASLVKKEGDLTKKAQEIKAAEAKIKEATEKYGSLFKAAEKFNEDPKALFAALNIDPKTLAAVLAKQENGKPTTDGSVEALVKRIDELESNLSEKEKVATEKAQMAELQVQEGQYKDFLKQHAEGNKEKYELVVTQNQYDLVFNVVREHWAASEGTQDPLTPDEALGMVEEYLREAADKLFGTEYAKTKFSGQSSKSETPSKKPKKKAKLETVGNNLGGEPSEETPSPTSKERWDGLMKKHFPNQTKPKPQIPKRK
jgi:hypothetical protein